MQENDPWGGAVGFDWAFHNQGSLRGIAYRETFVKPLEWEDLPEDFHPTLKAVRSDEGEQLVLLVLQENMFIEGMLPGVTGRPLTEEEMDEYRRPTLDGPRNLPIGGTPEASVSIIKAYGEYLAH